MYYTKPTSKWQVTVTQPTLSARSAARVGLWHTANKAIINKARSTSIKLFNRYTLLLLLLLLWLWLWLLAAADRAFRFCFVYLFFFLDYFLYFFLSRLSCSLRSSAEKEGGKANAGGYGALGGNIVDLGIEIHMCTCCMWHVAHMLLHAFFSLLSFVLLLFFFMRLSLKQKLRRFGGFLRFDVASASALI